MLVLVSPGKITKTTKWLTKTLKRSSHKHDQNQDAVNQNIKTVTNCNKMVAISLFFAIWLPH